MPKWSPEKNLNPNKFVVFELRASGKKNYVNHIFRIRICKKKFKMNFTFKVLWSDAYLILHSVTNLGHGILQIFGGEEGVVELSARDSG